MEASNTSKPREGAVQMPQNPSPCSEEGAGRRKGDLQPLSCFTESLETLFWCQEGTGSVQRVAADGLVPRAAGQGLAV